MLPILLSTFQNRPPVSRRVLRCTWRDVPQGDGDATGRMSCGESDGWNSRTFQRKLTVDWRWRRDSWWLRDMEHIVDILPRIGQLEFKNDPTKLLIHNDVMIWKYFSVYRCVVRGIEWSRTIDSWWRHDMETLVLLALYERNPWVTPQWDSVVELWCFFITVKHLI